MKTYIDIDRTWSRKNERPAESYQIGKKSCLTLRQISEFMNDHHSYTHNLSSCEIKGRTHDSRDTGAVLHRLSYQAIWELVTLWVLIYDLSYIHLRDKFSCLTYLFRTGIVQSMRFLYLL